MKKLLIVISILILFSSCKENKISNKLLKATLRQEWFPNANYAGELVAMYKMDEKYGLDLTIEAGSDDLDPIKLVLSGADDFGVVSADRLLEANDKGARLVAIGVANYKSPTCFISKKSDSIYSPKDFYGKKIGILTGTNTEIIYKLMVDSEKLDKTKLNEIEVPFDLGTFISGLYDLRPAFIYDEPVSLDLKKVSYNILKPEDFNINYMGTVYFCKEKLILENPKLVQAFVSSIIDGWKYTFSHQDESIKLLKKYDKSINVVRERLSLKKAIPYFKGEDNKLLYASEKTWNKMAQYLIQLGLIKKFKFKQSVNYKFLKVK